MIDDLKIIKKKYGEEMMHFCRDAFATILEEPSVLSNLLLTYFEPSKELFSDLEKENLETDFKNFIYRKFNKEEPLVINRNKTPQELLSSVGYDLFECESEEDIQKFKKYYAKGEKLCTFNGGRLNKCYVFFAVKKDVDNIKREDFNNPKRQDLYGTSVISIQFDKNDAHTLSIKNRYNHTVANPDATFSNNLDNIVEGLTDSFAEYYDLKQKYVNEFEIPNYERDNQGKYYKYIYEIDGTYYCTNNCILVEHEAIKFPKERYILAEYFLIDRQEKTITTYDNLEDAFVEMFDDNPIEKIDLEIKNDIKIVKIETQKGTITLELDKENKIIGLTNPYIEEIGNDFLYYNEALSKIELPQVKIIGNDFLCQNECLKELNLPNVTKVGNHFLHFNVQLKELTMPKVKEIRTQFLTYNSSLKTLTLPEIEVIPHDFLTANRCLQELSIPKVKEIGNNFLRCNKNLKKIDLSNVERIGDDFLLDNISLEKIDLPNVKTIDSCFLYNNRVLTTINLPNVLEINDDFLFNNDSLEKIYLPQLKIIGTYFLFMNKCLQDIYMPNIETIGDSFLYNNIALTKIDLSNVIYLYDDFLTKNTILNEVIINSEEAYQEFIRQHPEYQGKTLTRKLAKEKR